MAKIFQPFIKGDRLERVRKKAQYKRMLSSNKAFFVKEVENWLLNRKGHFQRYLDKNLESSPEDAQIEVIKICPSMTYYKSNDNWNIKLDLRVIPTIWFNDIKEEVVNNNFNIVENSHDIKNKEKGSVVDSKISFNRITDEQAEAYMKLRDALMSQEYY